MLSDEEKNSMELDIEAKYVGRTEKEFLNNITYVECLYILDTKNKYCDDIKNLSLLKIVDIVNEQSKEIEELKEKNEFLNWYFENQKENFIHKDKIKEMLEIKEDIDNEKILSLLQTIVDENARLEDIEDRKVQIEYNNVFNKGVKSVEDKIKAKIEELDYNDIGNFERRCKQEVLQSLLEKE